MTYLNQGTAEAILSTIIAVAGGKQGSKRKAVWLDGELRGNPVALYQPELLEAENLLEEGAFFEAGHWFDVLDGDMVDDPSIPVGVLTNRTRKLWDIAIEGLSSAGKGERADMDLRAHAAAAGHAIVLALGYPGNLLSDEQGRQTAIVDGRMRGPGGKGQNAVYRRGERSCHLLRWRVQGSLILDLEQEI